MEQTRIVGLADFQRELRALDSALPKELTKLNRSAADLAVGRARAKAVALGGVAAHVAPDIKAAAEQRRAKIVLDGHRTPEILGAEYGSLQYGQFRPWRGNQWTDPEGLDIGYFVHPTVRELARGEELFDLYGDGIDRLAASAFPD